MNFGFSIDFLLESTEILFFYDILCFSIDEDLLLLWEEIEEVFRIILGFLFFSIVEEDIIYLDYWRGYLRECEFWEIYLFLDFLSFCDLELDFSLDVLSFVI